MDRLKLDDFAGDFDDLLIDVDELQDYSNGPDAACLDRIASAPDDASEKLDDSSDFEVDTYEQ